MIKGWVRQNALRPSPCGTGNVTDGTFIERRVEVGTHRQPSQYSRSGPRAIVHLPDLCACLNRNLRRLRRTTYRTDPVQVRSCFINVYGPSYISLPHLFPQRMWDSIAFSYSILILHFTSSAFREPFILLPTPINNSTRYLNSNGNLSIQINNFYAFFFYSINNFILFPSLHFFLCKSPSLIYLPYKVNSTIKTVSSTLPHVHCIETHLHLTQILHVITQPLLPSLKLPYFHKYTPLHCNVELRIEASSVFTTLQ